MRHALLVYPAFPPSYWGYTYALDFVGKKSAMPPLGLLTVAALFPENDWHLKVVDMNVEPLTDADLAWADYVFTSTMIVQKQSFYEVLRRCNQLNLPVIAGGPHPTSYQEEIKQEADGVVSHFLSGEVEHIFQNFLTDLLHGTAKEVYEGPRTVNKVQTDITTTPVPRFDLIRLADYGSMAVQFSRGCPFDCEFCDITKLFGRVPRTKTNAQFLAEFDRLYELGWRDAVFVVDDNFIGNKRDAMRLLPAITAWQKERNYPFDLSTETSVNLVEIPGMLDAMAEAGFTMTFLGIESPNDAVLETTVKKQNTNRDETARDYLLRAVHTIQSHGIEVTAGFIIGLDQDTEFQPHIDFIQQAGIPRAMTGLLTALKKTNLYNRLEKEGRLLHESTGNNVSVELNFVPELDREVLIREYKRVLRALYDPSLTHFFARCLTLFEHLKPRQRLVRIGKSEMRACMKSIWRQLLSRQQGPAYLWFLWRVLRRYPRMLPNAVRMAIMGYHFEKVTQQQIAIDDFKQYLASELATFKSAMSRFANAQSDRIGEIALRTRDLLLHVHKQYEDIHEDFRHGVRDTIDAFQKSVFKQYLEAELDVFKEAVSRSAQAHADRLDDVSACVQHLFNRVHAQYEQIHHDFRSNVQDTLDTFRSAVQRHLEQGFGTNHLQMIEGLDPRV
jgi:radical SAM superfamily enzyme YgiQ (UPF0313 family)